MLVLAIVAAGLWTRRHYRSTTPRPTGALVRILPSLRWLTLTLLILAMAGPLLVVERTESVPALVLVVLDDSSSMELTDLPSGSARWDGAVNLAAALDSVISGRGLESEIRIWRGTGLTPPRTIVDLGSTEPPTAQGSDLEALLDGALKQSDGQPRFVVLLTDGHETARGSARDLPHQKQFWAAGLGDIRGPGDRWIRDVLAPDLAFVGDEVVVEVAVGLRGLPWSDDPVTVVLESGGREIARAERTVDVDDTTLRVELVDVPETPELKQLTVRVLPADGERYLGNNTSTLAVQVRDQTSRLLLLAARPDWTVRFLSQAGSMEERIQIDVVHPGRQGPVSAHDGSPWNVPRTPDEWRIHDGIILADAEAARSWINASSLQVALDAGLALLIVDGEGLLAWPAWLRSMLPVTRSEEPRVADGPLQWRETSHPVMTGLRDEGGRSRLPPATPSDGVKPVGTAQILASIGQAGRAEAPVLVTTSDPERRITWLGITDLWEQAFWTPRAMNAEIQPVRRLLRNLLVWTAQGHELSGQSLLASRIVYQEGESVPVRARGRGLRGDHGSTPTRIEVLSIDTSDDVRRYMLTADPAHPGEASALIPPLPVGRHRLQLLDQGDARTGDPLEILIAPGRVEARQTTLDIRRLRSLAETLGGQAVQASTPTGRARLLEAASVVDLTPDQRLVKTMFRPWSSWLAWLIPVVLLGLEWFLRRRAGLL